MKMINSFLLIMVLPIIGIAQTKEKAKPNRYLYHTHGISFQKFYNLNKRVTTNPMYEPIKNNVATFQFGFIGERKNTSFNTGITVGSSFSGKKNTRSTNIRILGFSLDAGYTIFTKDRFFIASLISIGLDNYTVKFNRDNSALPFDSVVASTNNLQKTVPLVFNNTFVNYRVGLSFNYKSKRIPRNAVGLQIGYAGSFVDNDWKINNTQILANSPKDGLSKIFTHIIFRYQVRSDKKPQVKAI